jgi:hypothetical protein
MSLNGFPENKAVNFVPSSEHIIASEDEQSASMTDGPKSEDAVDFIAEAASSQWSGFFNTQNRWIGGMMVASPDHKPRTEIE